MRLSRHTPTQGVVPAGLMYSAPDSATAAPLDRIATLGLATFRRHVAIRIAEGRAGKTSPEQRFRQNETPHTQAGCGRAAGDWRSVAFGWMTRVHPDEPRVSRGRQVTMASAEASR